jgi:hypothetical protein
MPSRILCEKTPMGKGRRKVAPSTILAALRHWMLQGMIASSYSSPVRTPTVRVGILVVEMNCSVGPEGDVELKGMVQEIEAWERRRPFISKRSLACCTSYVYLRPVRHRVGSEV